MRLCSIYRYSDYVLEHVPELPSNEPDRSLKAAILLYAGYLIQMCLPRKFREKVIKAKSLSVMTHVFSKNRLHLIYQVFGLKVSPHQLKWWSNFLASSQNGRKTQRSPTTVCQCTRTRYACTCLYCVSFLMTFQCSVLFCSAEGPEDYRSPPLLPANRKRKKGSVLIFDCGTVWGNWIRLLLDIHLYNYHNLLISACILIVADGFYAQHAANNKYSWKDITYEL